MTDDNVQQLIERCIGLEEEFIAAMSLGIQVYSRPLSFHLLTPTEHDGLFQNVDKVSIQRHCACSYMHVVINGHVKSSVN